MIGFKTTFFFLVQTNINDSTYLRNKPHSTCCSFTDPAVCSEHLCKNKASTDTDSDCNLSKH